MFETISHDPIKYSVDRPNINVSNFAEHSTGLQRAELVTHGYRIMIGVYYPL